jgi:hypothetical protein
MLLRDSPMQAWLKGRDDLWGQGPHWWQGPEGFSKAVSGSPGDLKVRLQSGKGPFVNHDAERYMAYGLASGRIGHDSPHKHTKIVTLREALARVWASVRTPGNLVAAFLLRISGQGQCVTESLDSVAPQLAAFMPSGCLRDDSYFAELRDDLVEADVQKLHDCRQFTARCGRALAHAAQHACIARSSPPACAIAMPQLFAGRERRADGRAVRLLPQPAPASRRHQANHAAAPFCTAPAAPLPVLARQQAAVAARLVGRVARLRTGRGCGGAPHCRTPRPQGPLDAMGLHCEPRAARGARRPAHSRRGPQGKHPTPRRQLPERDRRHARARRAISNS